MDIFDTKFRLPVWLQRTADWVVSPVALLIGVILLVVALLGLIDPLFIAWGLALLAAAEIALRATLPKPMRNHLWIPRSSAVFHPSPEGTPGVTGPCRFLANSLGLRADEPIPNRRHTVYVLGGSTAIDIWLDQRAAWVIRLQESLSRNGSPTWVAPLARPGFYLRHTAMTLDGVVQDIPRADLFINLAGGNDFQWAIGSSYARTAAEPVPSIFVESPGRLGQSGVGRLYYWWRDHMLSKAPVTKSFTDDGHLIWRRARQSAPPENLVDELPDLTDALVKYENDILALIERARRYGAPMLFLTQPTIWRAEMGPDELALIFIGGVGPNNEWAVKQIYYSPRALAEGMQRFNDKLIETCAKHGEPCYDLAADLPATAANYFDDAHFSDAGARVAGHLVAQAIERMELLERARVPQPA